MTTSWTDDEYGRVARALLLPSSRKTVVMVSTSQYVTQLRFELDARLNELDAATKTEVFAQIAGIEAAQRAFDVPLRSPDVSRVGEISRDVGRGLVIRKQHLGELRKRLAVTIGFDPDMAGAAYGSADGGINGRWSA